MAIQPRALRVQTLESRAEPICEKVASRYA